MNEWMRAVDAVGPLKIKLQRDLLPAAPRERLSWLQKRTSSATGRDDLAPSAGAMDIDEVRYSQVRMYGLATRLSRCKAAAATLADGVGMSDQNQPLLDYTSRRWDPASSTWQEIEACVHLQAARAGANVDVAWRGGVRSKT